MKRTEATFFEFAADESEKEIAALELLAEITAGKRVVLIGATITGELQLSYQTINAELSFRGCTFKELFSAENSLFNRRAEFSQNTTFTKGARFEGSIFKAFVTFTDCVVQEDANFVLTRFDQGLNASKTRFVAPASKPDKPENIAVQFNGAVINGDMGFREVIVDGQSRFERLKLFGSLYAGDSQFLAERAGDVANSFFAAEIQGVAFFSGALFKGNTSFVAVTVKGLLQLGLDYPGVDQRFRKAAHFEKDADFSDLRAEGPFEFVGGEVKGEASFAGTHFLNRAWFGARFSSATDMVKFNRAQFDAPVILEGQFLGGLWTFGARFNAYVKLRGKCAIEKKADWQETYFAGLNFSKDPGPTPQPFNGDIDWRRCRYATLQHDDGIKGFRELWEVLKIRWREQAETEQSNYEFSVQPYEQLEQACRQQGLSILADDIYYEMRCRAQSFEGRSIFYAWDLLERGLFGWGVRPLRMIGCFLLFWGLGALVFYRPGSLVGSAIQSASPTSAYYPALVSLQNLIPGLGEMRTLGATTNWAQPVAAVCALLQHVLGWVLVALLGRRFFGGLSHGSAEMEQARK